MRILHVGFLVFVLVLLSAAPLLAAEGPPPVNREFRGVWVATVGNIDWPSEPGLPVEKQKAELIAIFEKAASLNFNAIILQVRPAADALYSSKLEPWSGYLTGKQGRPPEPFYDPLKFAVREAHARGLQLHAWINPFRAGYTHQKGELAPNHISNTHPDFVKVYGDYLWMDPGVPAVRKHSLAVVKDIVSRYAVDGIHLDDYFYPYRVRDEEGNLVDFPDDASYQRYRAAGGKLERDDWRRSNVNRFVEGLYQMVKGLRPEVLVGISPFGIWRPGHPEQIRGLDAYAAIYADSRKWFRHGWVDYLSPQLYWPIGQRAQDYIALQQWWSEQNVKDRHLWPGLYTSRVGREWEPVEIVEQVKATRRAEGASGNIHFSMRALMGERQELEEAIGKLYAEPALVPASDWLAEGTPAAPRELESSASGEEISWKGEGSVARWVVQFEVGDSWETGILPGGTSSASWPEEARRVHIRAVSQTGQLSEAVTLTREE